MTVDQKKEIIDILEQYKAMLGVDKGRTQELIEAVKFIKCRVIDLTIDEQVKVQLAELCQQIGYEPTKENNKDRHVEMVAMRDAVTKVIFDSFGSYGNLFHVIADFWDKDRTSVIAQANRTSERLEIKDPIFMRYYNQLVTFNFLKSVA